MLVKQCPFCVADAEVRSRDNLNPQDGLIYNVRCSNPNCMGRSEKWRKSKVEAVRLWNKRVTV